ncbi:maleylpyruvate isomerase N-terminal domain-containing protein [Streptomyces mirabilis]|uniref:maleylpyruvate isomerase N-terminal domain-containing protein n=1 Tax=Streptomyces mirabilis TaxID=68239 RepID=UPI00368691EE
MHSGQRSSSDLRWRVVEAFRLAAGQLAQAMTGVSAAEWGLPTRCAPWKVSDLLAHVRVVIAWLPGMLAAPAPTCAEVSAVEYYRPDERFAPGTNAARIALAQEHAAEQLSGAALADDCNATWQEVDRLCRAEPEGRVVRTRHGDPMLLSEFLLTRVVEVAVHGLDLADALGRQPWLTAEAADLVQGILLGLDGAATLEKLGWGQLRFLRKATTQKTVLNRVLMARDEAGEDGIPSPAPWPAKLSLLEQGLTEAGARP